MSVFDEVAASAAVSSAASASDNDEASAASAAAAAVSGSLMATPAPTMGVTALVDLVSFSFLGLINRKILRVVRETVCRRNINLSHIFPSKKFFRIAVFVIRPVLPKHSLGGC